jgi:putative restriction endonuclease
VAFSFGSVGSADFDGRLRQTAMDWLDELTRHGVELLSFAQLAEFQFEGQRIALMDRQRGIRKPAALDAALSFRTTFTPPGQVPPYEDAEGRMGYCAISTEELIRSMLRTSRCGGRSSVGCR